MSAVVISIVRNARNLLFVNSLLIIKNITSCIPVHATRLFLVHGIPSG